MIQRMCISQTFSLATPFAFILLIPFLLYYSLKTFSRPASTLKELPAHHEYRLPDFLVSPHVDKTKYLRRVMKLKDQIKYREQENNYGYMFTSQKFDYRNQNFLGRCSIGLEAYAQINEHSYRQEINKKVFLTKIARLTRYGKKNSKKKWNYGFEPTKLTIIHEDAQY